MNHMHTIFATTTSSSPALVLSQVDVYDIIIFLVFVALVIVILPLLLSRCCRTKSNPLSDIRSTSSSFFEIPYITWFLVHYGISALAVIAILILGLDGVIDKGTVSALLGSLFGYVLGSTAKGSASPQQHSDSTGLLTGDNTESSPESNPSGSAGK